MSTLSTRKPPPATAGRKWILLAVVTSVGVGLALYLHLPARAQELLQFILDRIKPLGFWAPVLFVLLYIVSCVAMIPGSVLTLGGGAIFGLVEGSIYVSIGATLGATAAFLSGRHFARDWVTAKIGAHPTFAALDQAVAGEGWRIVLLTRLCAIFPFFLLNYGYGLTRVSLRHYVLATWIGIIPGSTVLVYLGSLARTSGQPASPIGWAWKVFALISVVVTTIYLTRVARRALAKKLPPQPGDANGPDR
jgi:uncharacterized membrane protein YdjX (TVP38/TMEM64 family)